MPLLGPNFLEDQCDVVWHPVEATISEQAVVIETTF